MGLFKKLKTYQLISKSIEQQSTGKPNDFAKKLGICPSTLYQMLADLKAEGVPLFYDKTKNSYCYESKTIVIIKSPVEIIKL